MKEGGHLVMVSYGAQGLINPTLQLAHRLLRLRFRVTLLTTVFAHRRIMSNAAANVDIPHGLRLAAFSDGFDDGFAIQSDDLLHLVSQVKRAGSQTLSDLIVSASTLEEGCPVTCLLNTLNLSWVSTVARRYHLPCAHLWVQPCTALGIYYHYFNGFGDVIRENCADPSWSVRLPGLPSLKGTDLPTFMSSTTTGSAFDELALQTFRELIDTIQADEKPILLVNSFPELEPEAFKSLAVLNPIGIGPLIPSALLHRVEEESAAAAAAGGTSSSSSFHAELFRSAKDCGAWMASKPKSSVIYVSFGTLFAPSSQQVAEMARGLLASNRPFLWVNKEVEEEEGGGGGSTSSSDCGCKMGLDKGTTEELENRGMIISWVRQAEVLANPAVGCFVSHCGWNSVLESLAAGLPVVAIPQSSDQGTNARLVAEEFGIGERGRKNREGIVEAEEIRRCIELVMSEGGEGEEVRRNCKKWKQLVRDAAMKSDSDDEILREFVGGLAS